MAKLMMRVLAMQLEMLRLNLNDIFSVDTFFHLQLC